MDTCHTSDKGKGRGSPVLANTPALRPQSSKKSSSVSPSQQPKKHKVSLYYSKYKSSTSTAAAASVDEEHEELTPESPLTPDPCNNNPAFIDELDNKADDLQSSMEEMVSAAGMFPMEIPAEFPTDASLDPGSRPVLLFYSPLDRSCTEHYAQKMDSEKRDNSEPEVRKRCWIYSSMCFSLFEGPSNSVITDKYSQLPFLVLGNRRKQRPEKEGTRYRDVPDNRK